MTNLGSMLKRRDIILLTKVYIIKAMVFSSSHVQMWELDHKESWVLKNWCFWTVVLEKTLDSPLDCKEIQLVHPKGNQSWIFGRTDAKAEAPILWPLDAKNWLIRKDSDAGQDWGQEEKGMTEDEMDSWMASPTQWAWVCAGSRNWWWTGKLSREAVCCSAWGHKELDMTEQLNWTQLNYKCVNYSC